MKTIKQCGDEGGVWRKLSGISAEDIHHILLHESTV